jgi:hypothetical protein
MGYTHAQSINENPDQKNDKAKNLPDAILLFFGKMQKYYLKD